jgi:hypothetical protein
VAADRAAPTSGAATPDPSPSHSVEPGPNQYRDNPLDTSGPRQGDGRAILLFQVLLMSRVGSLERWIGAHSLLIWRWELGGYLLVAAGVPKERIKAEEFAW